MSPYMTITCGLILNHGLRVDVAQLKGSMVQSVPYRMVGLYFVTCSPKMPVSHATMAGVQWEPSF